MALGENQALLRGLWAHELLGFSETLWFMLLQYVVRSCSLPVSSCPTAVLPGGHFLSRVSLLEVALGDSTQLVPFFSGKEFLGSGLSLRGAVLVSQFSKESVGLLEPRERQSPRRWVRFHML